MKNEREFGLDLTRATAVILVLAVHFFLYDGFYSTLLAGRLMLLSTVLRMACMACVPLFLLLTGYLCAGRGWTKGYYWKLLPVLLTYLLAGAACLLFRYLWLGEQVSVFGVFRRLLDFSAAPYAWYIRMYIGLFLLSPFFNAGWHALDGRGRRALVLTLIGLTALPPLTNQVYRILPDWWTGIYPITYYAVGAYLREYPFKWKKWGYITFLGINVCGGVPHFSCLAGKPSSSHPSRTGGACWYLARRYACSPA